MYWTPNKVEFLDTSEEVLKEAARITDDHGLISIYRHKTGFKYVCRYRFDVPDLRDWLFEHFGGYVSDQLVGDGKTFYWLNFQQSRCKKFLATVRPYLVRKKQHARLMDEFDDLVKLNRKRKVTPEHDLKRNEIIDQIKVLNKQIWEAASA